VPTIVANGARLFYTLTGGAGPPLVLVHGSWGDHTSWNIVVPALAHRFRVVAYDRRGHSQSERPPGQGSAEQDAADLADLIAGLGLAPAHVAANSFGASIALRLAIRRPDLVRGVIAHEPPLLDLPLANPADARAAGDVRERIAAVAARLAAGEMEAGTRDFYETVAFSPGTWSTFALERQRYLVDNAPTFLDEARDPDAYRLDLDALATYGGSALLTYGDRSLPFYAPIVFRVAAALGHAETRVIAGAGHVPHATHPDDYAAVIVAFAEAADAERR
jgi:pimeloyl-ACP methyl ester carboxylesterase